MKQSSARHQCSTSTVNYATLLNSTSTVPTCALVQAGNRSYTASGFIFSGFFIEPLGSPSLSHRFPSIWQPQVCGTDSEVSSLTTALDFLPLLQSASVLATAWMTATDITISSSAHQVMMHIQLDICTTAWSNECGIHLHVCSKVSCVSWLDLIWNT